MVFITEGFFEVAIESWPEWDLKLCNCNGLSLFCNNNNETSKHCKH